MRVPCRRALIKLLTKELLRRLTNYNANLSTLSGVDTGAAPLYFLLRSLGLAGLLLLPDGLGPGQLNLAWFPEREKGDHKLSHLLPARPRRNYHLRSNRKFVVPDCKTNRYRDSFIISHCT